jgi:hypothetical protein
VTSAMPDIEESVVVFSQNHLSLFQEVNIKFNSPQQADISLQKMHKTPIHPAISFAEQFWIGVQANLE